MHRAGNSHTPRLTRLFEACRDVDAATEEVVVLDDDIAQMDADAKDDALVRRNRGIAGRQGALHIQRRLHRIHRAGELDENAVAGGFDHTPAVLLDLGIDNFFTMGPKLGQGARFVDLHQTAVADNIRRQNGGKPTFVASVSQNIERVQRTTRN